MSKMLMSDMYQWRWLCPTSIYCVQHVKDAYVQYVSTKTLYTIVTYLYGLCPRWLCPTCINKNFVYHCHLIKWVMPKMLMSDIYKKNFVYSVVTFWIMSMMIMSNMYQQNFVWHCHLPEFVCQRYYVQHALIKSFY